MTIPMHGQSTSHDRDDSPSVYSRSTTSPSPGDGRSYPEQPLTPSEYSHRPEVKPIDHQIAIFGGTSVALETTGVRLQMAKNLAYLPLEDRLQVLAEELAFHQEENKFFGTCTELLGELLKVAEDVYQILKLQYCFEPETRPVGNERLLAAARTLQNALAACAVRETRAENEWKEFWNIPGERLASEWI